VAPGNQWTTNTWDGENRLAQVALPSGIVDSFIYNGDGQRVQKQDSTGITNHVWDGQNILLETNASNIVQVVYTLGPEVYGNLISQSRAAGDSFYLFDALGSTRQLSNAVATVTDGYLYDCFGNLLLLSGSTANWFRFVGRYGYYFDQDLANFYIRSRVYAPAVGRFLSPDTLDSVGLASGSYAYSWNSPASMLDPSGRQGIQGPGTTKKRKKAPTVPPVNAGGCTGGCVSLLGNAKITVDNCNFTKIATDPNQPGCVGITSQELCGLIDKVLEGYNKGGRLAKNKVVNSCSDGCTCDPNNKNRNVAEGQRNDWIQITNMTLFLSHLDRNGKKNLSCTVTVSGTVDVLSGSIGLSACVKKRGLLGCAPQNNGPVLG
jgi:RHS repeat-associated protein